MKFPNLKFNLYSLCISALFLGSYQTSAMAFTLDVFSDANQEFPIGSGDYLQQVDVNRNALTGSDLDTNLSGTDLGQRQLDITLKSGSSRKGYINVDTFLGQASIGSEPGTTIQSAKFTWGSDSTPFQDITTGGLHNSFQLNVITIDLIKGADFTFTIEDSAGLSSSVTQKITSVGDTYFPYQSFGPSVNKNAIREVSLGITNAPADFDASFDFIQSARQVPFDFSPSLGLVCCGGLFGLNKFRKRLQSSKY